MHAFDVPEVHPHRRALIRAQYLTSDFRVAAEKRVMRDPRTRALAKRRWYS